MAVRTDTAVAAELRVSFWVSDALADCHFVFHECILKSHYCFQLLLLWRKSGCRGLFGYAEKESNGRLWFLNAGNFQIMCHVGKRWIGCNG